LVSKITLPANSLVEKKLRSRLPANTRRQHAGRFRDQPRGRRVTVGQLLGAVSVATDVGDAAFDSAGVSRDAHIAIRARRGYSQVPS
jgi:hypothetical protein